MLLWGEMQAELKNGHEGRRTLERKAAVVLNYLMLLHTLQASDLLIFSFKVYFLNFHSEKKRINLVLFDKRHPNHKSKYGQVSPIRWASSVLFCAVYLSYTHQASRIRCMLLKLSLQFKSNTWFGVWRAIWKCFRWPNLGVNVFPINCPWGQRQWWMQLRKGLSILPVKF